QRVEAGIAAHLERPGSVSRERRRGAKPYEAPVEGDEQLLVETERPPVRRDLDRQWSSRLPLEDEEPSRRVHECDAVSLAQKVAKQVERMAELVDAFPERPRRVLVVPELGRGLLAGRPGWLLAFVDQQRLRIRDPVAVGVSKA